MVWAEFVTTSIILVTTSKIYGYRRHGGHYAERAYIGRTLNIKNAAEVNLLSLSISAGGVL